MFKAKCQLILAVTQHKKIKEIVSSILDWHEFDSERYPTEAQEKLVDGFWRRYRDKCDKPVKRFSTEAFTFEA